MSLTDVGDSIFGLKPSYVHKFFVGYSKQTNEFLGQLIDLATCAVVDLGGGWGGQGVATLPPPKKLRAVHTKCTTNTVLGMQTQIYIAMSMVVVVLGSEQAVKPRSRLAVVKPEVLHLLECQLLELYYKLGQLEWVWF